MMARRGAADRSGPPSSIRAGATNFSASQGSPGGSSRSRAEPAGTRCREYPCRCQSSDRSVLECAEPERPSPREFVDELDPGDQHGPVTDDDDGRPSPTLCRVGHRSGDRADLVVDAVGAAKDLAVADRNDAEWSRGDGPTQLRGNGKLGGAVRGPELGMPVAVG